MKFGLFNKKRCPICGESVEKNKAIKRFGRHFCSEAHAEEHRQKLAKEASEAANGGSCCGK